MNATIVEQPYWLVSDFENYYDVLYGIEKKPLGIFGSGITLRLINTVDLVFTLVVFASDVALSIIQPLTAVRRLINGVVESFSELSLKPMKYQMTVLLFFSTGLVQKISLITIRLLCDGIGILLIPSFGTYGRALTQKAFDDATKELSHERAWRMQPDIDFLAESHAHAYFKA